MEIEMLINFLILYIQMKRFFVLFAIIAIVIIAGCVGQNETQTETQEPQSGKNYEFATLEEAYDSGIELKCEIKTEVVRISYYIADMNIRVELSGPAGIAYQIFTKTNEYHSWSNLVDGVVTLSDSSVERSRKQLFLTPFKDIECFQQSISNSMFEPPEQ